MSDCCGGRVTDAFIVQDCGFLEQLQCRDQIMADRGFKSQDKVAFYKCTLATPPSKHTNIPMNATDVHKTSTIANVKTY